MLHFYAINFACILGYSQVGKAPGFDPVIVGSSPPTPAIFHNINAFILSTYFMKNSVDIKTLFTSTEAMMEYGNGNLLSYATEGSSGVDLRAISYRKDGSSEFMPLSSTKTAEYIIKPSEKLIIGCGIKVSIPKGFEFQIRSRSGLSSKNQIVVLNSPGTIDSDYRGEICAIIKNMSQNEYEIGFGDKIAQMVLAPIVIAKFEFVSELDETNRGEKGFGSTGKK